MSWQVYLENQVLNSGFRAIALEYGWKGPAIDYHKQHLNSPLGKWIVCRDGKLYGYVAEQKQTEVIQPSQALENILGRKDEGIKMIFTIDNNQVVITKNGISIGNTFVSVVKIQQIILAFQKLSQ